MTRVTLRPLTEADRSRVHEILSAPEVSQWWGDPDEETDGLLAKDEEHAYAIEHNGQTVGIIQSWEETTPRYRHAGIDLAVHPGHYGLGSVRRRSGSSPSVCSTRGTIGSPSIRRRPITVRFTCTRSSVSAASGFSATTSKGRTAPGTTVC